MERFKKPLSTNYHIPSTNHGFTIIELLITIIVIGILAAIIIVAYSGITKEANKAALQSDLANASRQIKLYKLDHRVYPNSINDCPTPAVGNMCLEVDPDIDYSYLADNSTNPKTFRLTGSNDDIRYYVTNDSSPAIATCLSGFISVPGSATYGTDDFCVMKYEAKRVGVTNVPISEASGLPWVNISQTDALAYSPNVAGCIGCHLITEAEWLTIVQNVLSVSTNWDNGAGVHSVGTGYIYRGHSDDTPLIRVEASTNDSDGYYGTNGNVAPSNQRRTLTLTNGEVIWDLAGNVHDRTQGTIAGGQQPGIDGGGYAWREWNNASIIQRGLPSSAYPVFGTPAASGWTSSTNGIGTLYSNYNEAVEKSFLRGGYWHSGSVGGVATLFLLYAPSSTSDAQGFRVAVGW